MPQALTRLRALAAIPACLPLAALALWAAPLQPRQDSDEIEASGPAPVWPLGLDGALSRVLLSTHGQYYKLGGASAFAHSGIDLGACPYEPVFAAEDGTVVFLWADASDSDATGQELIVSRGSDLSRGLRYLHMASVEVKLGEAVKRDQLLGSVAPWDDPVGCDHLHLQTVSCSKAGEAWPAGYAADDGNPLLVFETLSDGLAPVVQPMPSKLGVDLELVLYEDGSSNEVVQVELGQPIDVVVCVHDRFTGDTSPECDPPDAGAVAPSELVAPFGFSLRATWVGATEAEPLPAASTGPDSRIELGDPVGTLHETALAEHLYHGTSVGTFTERELRFVLTNDLETGSGAWTPDKAGFWRLEVGVEDAAHNVTYVPARTVSVGLP